MEVTLRQGRVRGTAHDGITSFKGIPYAPAPFGPLRFAPPGDPPAWDGVRDATAYGPTAPKPPYPVPIDTILPEPVIPGEECLNLNVWTPDPGAEKLPVLVWIHGGAFVNGSGAVSTYDGSAFARDGIVCVTINYRLGVDGFALLPDAVPNRGLLDQVAALRWVQENIDAFGGDPAKVAIAGESAGAMSVATLIAMPRAAGLFARAILESGAGSYAIKPDTARRVTAALAQRLGVAPTAESLAAVALPQLTAEQAALSQQISLEPLPDKWGELATNLMPFEPTVDGDVLPSVPLAAIRAGAGRDLDVLIGTTSEEHALFLVPNGFVDLIDDRALDYTCALLRADAGAVRATYSADGRSPGEILLAAMTDWFFRVPAIRLAEARSDHGAATFMYEFAWRSPLLNGRLGACHALEIPFVFDALEDEGTAWIAGPEPPQSVADDVHGAWVAFVRDGDPGWEPYLPQRRVRRFGEPTDTVSDPRAEQRELWTGIR